MESFILRPETDIHFVGWLYMVRCSHNYWLVDKFCWGLELLICVKSNSFSPWNPLVIWYPWRIPSLANCAKIDTCFLAAVVYDTFRGEMKIYTRKLPPQLQVSGHDTITSCCYTIVTCHAARILRTLHCWWLLRSTRRRSRPHLFSISLSTYQQLLYFK